jgi:hypothetical protein
MSNPVDSIDPESTNDGSSKELRDELKESRNKARKSFWKVASAGFWRLMDRAPSVYASPTESRFYRHERALLAQHADPFFWGAFTTVFLFLTFRVSGSRFYSRFRENLFSSAKKPAASQSPPTKQRPQWKSYSDRQAAQFQVEQKDLYELPLDLLVSLCCGGSAVLWLLPRAQIQSDFVAAPLQPGKSLVADLLCPEMERVLRREVDPRILTPDIVATKDDSLALFLAFCQNCRTRQEFITYQQQRGTVRRPEVIPYPGLEGVRR